ncbi:MAG: N-acetylglucosamine-6-phosphate deacetylase [Alphaproteobacteria bacterium]|nr:N-acetylglucosamine-6-phosphate deacetylase [Alphaproteobacteria bacterium]
MLVPPDAASWWLAPRRLFDGTAFHHGSALRIESGKIAAIGKVTGPAPVVTSDFIAAPGFIDLQVNGGGGALFNNAPSVETLATIGAAHRARGTTSWLATFITDTPDRLDQAVGAVIANAGANGVAGIHVEGPHLAPERRGTHAAQYLRPFDDRTLASVKRLRAANIPTMLTLAPDRVESGTIRKLTDLGVVVSAGHTAANAAQIRAALDEGLRCFTHLHNAMTPMNSREPGVVGAALDSDAYCGVIADLHHVSATTLRVSLRARPRPDRMFLVSDAMSTVGGPDFFELYGRRIEVRDGRLVNAEGSLAGAHIDMATSVRNVATTLGEPIEHALAMATSIPATAMRLDGKIGAFAPGAKADIVLLDDARNARDELA